MKRNTEAIIRLAQKRATIPGGVSSWLCKSCGNEVHPPAHGKEMPVTPRVGEKSEAAKDAQIARLQDRVRTLEREVQRLREENALLYGRLAERS